jgi:hypothetical protein
MASIRVIVKGTDSDHTVQSPTLADEEASDQLHKVGAMLASGADLQLPWLRCRAAAVLAAYRVD